MNSTADGFSYGHYGSRDSHGFISSVDRIGTWSTTPTDDAPDVLFDLYDPKTLSGSLTNGHTVKFDQNRQAIVITNCTHQLTYPLDMSGIVTRSENPTGTLLGQPFRVRDTYKSQGTFKVTVSYKTHCGDVSPYEYEPINCEDVTPGQWLRQYPKDANAKEVRPGTWQATCKHADTSDYRNHSPACDIVEPVLWGFCQVNSFIQSLNVPELVCGIAVKYSMGEQCLLVVEALKTYCQAQTAIGGSEDDLRHSLCGATPAYSETRVLLGKVRSSIFLADLYKEDHDLGTVKSTSNHDIDVVVGPKMPSGSTCGACVDGMRMFNSSWQSIYSGDKMLPYKFCSYTSRWEELDLLQGANLDSVEGSFMSMADAAASCAAWSVNKGNCLSLCPTLSPSINDFYLRRYIYGGFKVQNI